MARQLLLLASAAVLLLASAPPAAASADIFIHNNWGSYGWCIPCTQCWAPGCWRICQPSCGIQPNNIIVNGDSCRSSGYAFGPSAAQQACTVAKQQCGGVGALATSARLGGVGPVTLPQCSNIAQGACLQAASPWNSPCAYEAQAGYGSCDASTFGQLYEAAATGSCTTFAQTVTGVTPGTNSWSNGGGNIIIGSSYHSGSGFGGSTGGTFGFGSSRTPSSSSSSSTRSGGSGGGFGSWLGFGSGSSGRSSSSSGSSSSGGFGAVRPIGLGSAAPGAVASKASSGGNRRLLRAE